MSDIIEKLGYSTIHHGKENNRLYLMKYDEKDGSELLNAINDLSTKNNYRKVIAKVPANKMALFEADGYKQEAYIPKYYKGIDDCIFMCKYLESSINEEHFNYVEKEIINCALKKANKVFLPILSKDFTLRKLIHEDAEAMAELFKKVFDTYPFPVYDPSYLIETMKEHIIYYGVFNKDTLIGIASSEIDYENLNCEMTDFAILPEYRGNNFALLLLKEMEQLMRQKKFKVLYTIARSMSYGMNITFSKLGYTYSGTLYDNTNISGSIEDMNVWYKIL